MGCPCYDSDSCPEGCDEHVDDQDLELNFDEVDWPEDTNDLMVRLKAHWEENSWLFL